MLSTIELLDGLRDIGDLLVGELRIHGQRKDLVLAFVSDREVGGLVPEVAIGRRPGQGCRVMDAGEYALGLEESRQIVPALGPDDVEMEDVEGIRTDLRDFDIRYPAEELVILQGVAVPGLVPGVDM